jgi:hypothetical protein
MRPTDPLINRLSALSGSAGTQDPALSGSAGTQDPAPALSQACLRRPRGSHVLMGGRPQALSGLVHRQGTGAAKGRGTVLPVGKAVPDCGGSAGTQDPAPALGGSVGTQDPAPDSSA